MQVIYIVHVDNDSECDEYNYYFANLRAAEECFQQILNDAQDWKKNPEDKNGHSLAECLDLGECELPSFFAELGTEQLLDEWN